MRKVGAILILALFIIPFLLEITKAQEQVPGLPPYLGEDPEETIEGYKTKAESTWEYLNREWKNILLKKKSIAAMDSYFKQHPKVFYIFLGEQYSFSLTIIVMMILWLIFLYIGARISNLVIKIKSKKKPKFVKRIIIPFFIGVAFSMALAHLTLLRRIANFFGWLVFAKKEWWWHALMIIGIIVVIIIIILFWDKIIQSIFKEHKAKKQEKTIEKTEEKVKEIEKEEEEEDDEDIKRGKRFLKIFGEELGKKKGEGEFETPDFEEPKFEKP